MKEILTARQRIQTYFLAGVLTLAPVAMTTYLVYLIASFSLEWLVLRPTDLMAEYLPVAGRIVTLPMGRWIAGGMSVGFGLVIITLSGYLATGAIGRFAGRVWKRIIGQLPIVSSLHTGLTQMIDVLFRHDAVSFRKVAFVKFPSASSVVLGFISSEIELAGRGKHYSVFVPTTPNPTTGFSLLIHENELEIVDISVEDAMKFVVSLGMIVPRFPSGKS